MGIGVAVVIRAIWRVTVSIVSVVTKGHRKWYYYDSDKPWKGGYFTPRLPNVDLYNDYTWSPERLRYEHKVSGQPICNIDHTINNPRDTCTK